MDIMPFTARTNIFIPLSNVDHVARSFLKKHCINITRYTILILVDICKLYSITIIQVPFIWNSFQYVMLCTVIETETFCFPLQ